ncbi:glycosyltransferase family 2 protein [Falsiroseomonas sp. HW251]|uniref:glycosyltransferase family 2 protein n=1 Tax=Falsiroseomonas sp. HW251 TaxID=3390998 RepID=UPI003D31B291
MIRFSLVMPTKGRTEDIAIYIDALLMQGRDDYELIVVDQNEDDRLVEILGRFAGRLPVTHIRSSVSKISHARNLGLREAKGEIVSVPDDDCIYPPGALDHVARAFDEDPDLAILTGPSINPDGTVGSGRFQTEGGPVEPGKVWTSMIEFNTWVRRSVMLALGGFDEEMGLGTYLSSAEGPDFMLRAILAGHATRFDPSLKVIHPDKRQTNPALALARAAPYGRGLGFALRRHGVPASVWLTFMVRPLGGALISLAKLDVANAKYYGLTLVGRLQGFLRSDAGAGRVRAPMDGQP